MVYHADVFYDKFLEHHGILGMKWGIRRYQNLDGSLTEKGKKRYNKIASSENKQDKEKYKTLKYLRGEYEKSASAVGAFEESSKTALKNAELYGIKAAVYEDKDKVRAASKAYKDSVDAFKRSEEYKRILDKQIKNTAVLKQLISDVSSDKIKAGKDYILQVDKNLLGSKGIYYKDYRLVQNKGNDISSNSTKKLYKNSLKEEEQEQKRIDYDKKKNSK